MGLLVREGGSIYIWTCVVRGTWRSLWKHLLHYCDGSNFKVSTETKTNLYRYR